MKDVEKYTSEAKIFSDTQKASVTKVAKSGTNLVLTFDEPISSTGSTEIYLDGTKLAATALTDASTKLGEYVYTVALAAGAEQTTAATVGTHSVDVYYVTDAATNTTLKTTGTFSVGTDTTAPSVSKIEAVNSTTFRVYTSEALANLASSNLTIKKGNYTFGSSDYTVSSYNTTDGYYTVTLNPSVLSNTTNPLYASGESSVALSVGVSGIIDTAGLVGNNYSGSVTLSKDTTAPKLVSDSANYADVANKYLYVKLDEDVDAASVDSSKIVVRDADGLKQTVSAATAVQGKGETGTTEYLRVTLGALASSSYTVSLGAGAIADTAGNANNSTLTSNVAVKAVGAEQLALTYGTEVTVANNVISINYGKDMGSSAISLANYKFNDGAFPTGTTINWGADKQHVEIVLPNNTFAKDTTGVLTVTSGVKTDAGKAIYADAALTTENVIKLGATDINDNIAPTLTKAAYVVTNSTDVTSNKLRLTFSEAVALTGTAANNIDDFAVKIGDKTIAVTAVAAGSSSNVLELTLGDTVAVSQSAIVSVVTDKLVNTTGISVTDASVLANKLAAGSVTATTKEQ